MTLSTILSLSKLNSTDELIISPDKGELGPNQKILIVFTINQKHLPTFWEGEINCRIRWKSIMMSERMISEDNDMLGKSNMNEKNPFKTDMLFIRIKKSPLINVS